MTLAKESVLVMEGRFKKPSYFPQVKVWVGRGRAGALVWSSGGGLKRKSQSSESGDRRSRQTESGHSTK